MDRRKLTSKGNSLHRQLHSSSQILVSRSGGNSLLTSSSTQLGSKSGIVRSASAIEAPRTGQTALGATVAAAAARKRKNSEKEKEMDENDENDEEPVRVSPVKSKRKKPNVIEDDENDDEDEQMEEVEEPTSSKRDTNKFAKPAPSKKKPGNASKNEDAERNSGGSYMKNILATLDKSCKSPSKLSQSSTSSNSSVDKYCKIGRRTPVLQSLRQQKSAGSKAVAEKKTKETEKPVSSASSNKIDLKKSPAKPASKKKIEEKKSSSSESSSDEEMSFSDVEAPPKKITRKYESPLKRIAETSKAKDSSIKAKGSPVKTKESPVKAKTTPVKNQRNRVIESPDISPLKDFTSPEKINTITRRKKTVNNTDDKFIDFVSMVDIILNSGDDLHVASNDPREITQKMKDLLSTDKINIDELIKSWNDYIDDEENLKKSLLEMKIETDEGVAISSKAVSLSRLLLQVPQLQVEIFSSMFRKLIDAVITTDSSDDAPWAVQMLQQFRFLEVLVDPDFLIKQIEDLLSSSPEWFQREVILFIPDIVTDTQHRITAEMLVKIMENNSDLTNIILDCMHNLILGKDYREELREQVLGLLDKSFDKNIVPAITRFVLASCSTEVVALKTFNVLRLIDMTPTGKEKLEECYTAQTFMVNAIKSSIQSFKEVNQAALILIKTPASQAMPLDMIISILLYETTAAKKKIVDATLQHHIKVGYYKTNFLSSLYTGYKEVMRSFQLSTLNIAMELLKANNESHVEFGVEWLRNIFISQADASYKQREIMQKLLNLMGNKDKTVKNALEVLCRMANDDHQRQFLEQHAGFLRSFLEKIDNLKFDEVATLYHLLHGLCTQSEKIANILNDDLSIILQKQLSSSKVLTKCKGVVGAVMAIKHLAGSKETSDEAFELLKRTLSSLKGCVRSQALFYDQLGQVIASTENIDENFLNKITDYFEEDFINNCLVDSNPSNALEPKFGLNDPSMAESYFVHFGNGKAGATVPVFFKLLRVCCLRLSDSLESINAVLGCSILMPEDMDMPEPTTADCMIHCINWFREIIGGFVTQEETLLRDQVLKRLDSLMSLQGEFVTMVAMCDSRYQPPPCYFHHFPVPQFVRIDLKLGKKGGKKGRKPKNKEKEKEKEDCTELTLNKSVLLPEWENWETGSEMTIKNPAFFRRMDTKIIHLLDANMDIHSTQSTSQSITIAQVCFIVKELLGMFENQVSESFIRDLIQLLPKICAKLKKIIADLRENDSAHEKEAVRLLLCLLITLFSWKEFQNARYNTLLRDGLRTLAGMINESSALLRSCKDLVAEAYKYFESLSDIATQISLAVALVNMCSCLMKHSNSFTEQSRERHAKMAYGFLCLEWTNDTHGPQYKVAVKELLKTWMENECNPLQTVFSVLEWLPDEAAALDRPHSRLGRLPAVTKVNFHLLLKQLFSGLVKGIEISLDMAEKDPERIHAWVNLAACLERMANICKTNKNNLYLMFYLRYTTILYQTLLSSGMKLLEANIKYQTEDVLTVIKLFQKSGRFMRDIFCTARKDKNVSLLKLVPIAKSRREKFIYRVKGMLAANNSIGAFWMGNLLNKDLDGEEIASETSEDLGVSSDVTENSSQVAEEEGSEIFNSDSDEEEDESGD